jgi:hypothetical protein
VNDLQPPKFAANERTTLTTLLQYQRDSFVRKVSGASDFDARRRMVPTDTTLLWLTKHLRRAEVMWVLIRFAGQDLVVPDDAVGHDDRLEAAIDDYRATWRDVDAVVDAHDLDDPCRALGMGGPVPDLRWVVAHLLEETARHAGHADIIRELIDGRTGR